MEPDTPSLIDEASRGSALAVDVLLARYLPGLRAYVRLRAGPAVRHKDSVSDVVQSACREVLANVDRFRYGGEAGFKAWLYATALRRIQKRHDYHHAQKRDIAREVAVDPARVRTSDLLDCYRTFTTPSAHAIAREEAERIERAFDGLNEEQREVVIQSRLIGLSHKEIARAIGKSEGATRVLLHRALVRLAELLDTGAGGDA